MVLKVLSVIQAIIRPFNSFPVEQVIEIFEKLLDKQKEQFETLKKEKK